MRSTTDILDIKYAFTQRSPLTPAKFMDEYKRRELHSNLQISLWDQLEALHRAQVLIPIYRLRKNVDQVLNECRHQKIPLISALVQQLGDDISLSYYLDGYTGIGHLRDPRNERFRPWPNYIRKIQSQLLWTSTFFYSPYQLLLVPMLQRIIQKLRGRHTPRKYSSLDLSYSLRLNDKMREYVEREITENHELVIVLSALEPTYLPWIVGHVTNRRSGKLEDIFENRRSFDPIQMLRWLGWEAEKVKKAAERLLGIAESLDPINDWYELVRLCRPDMWDKLRGDALVAIDHRIAAEILLRFYEDLVMSSAASPLEPVPKRFYAPRRRRLNTERFELDKVLTDYGLSPQPSLVLVLEGDTEWLLIPRIMNLMGVPRQRSFIELFKGRGVNTDFGLLASYVAAPYLGEPISNGFVLTRPPTHFLVAVDAEGDFVTKEACEKQRKKWVEQIYKMIEKEHRTLKLKDELFSLVSIETWDGQSFEFAHFTNKELAAGILEAYGGQSHPSLANLQTWVENIRTKSGNLETIWESWKPPRPTKTKLAEKLWPLLERKIEDAITRNDTSSIPVVRVLHQAYKLAAELPRHSVMIEK